VTTATTMHFPAGWIGGGSHAEDYEIRLDRSGAHGGGACVQIRSLVEAPRDFITLTQGFRADEYLGQRLRLSAFIRAENVEGWAGMWMRVDPRKKDSATQFDNMQRRPIQGTRVWQQYQIVLDVPDDSNLIYFGVLLHGKGAVWVDDFQFEVVGEDVPTTGAPSLPRHPVNLNFEE
jgi:hypothetical protein